MKKLLVVLAVLGLCMIAGPTPCPAEIGTATYVHFGGSLNRISGHDGISKFAQANGSLEASVEGENILYSNWRARSYGFVAINTDRDYICGLGLYLGKVGRIGIQIGNYYEQATDKDYLCGGLYADASILRGIWQKFITIGNSMSAQ